MESHEKEQNRSKIALSSSSPLFVTPTPTTLLFERRLHRLYHPILLLQTCTITDRLLAITSSSIGFLTKDKVSASSRVCFVICETIQCNAASARGFLAASGLHLPQASIKSGLPPEI